MQSAGNETVGVMWCKKSITTPAVQKKTYSFHTFSLGGTKNGAVGDTLFADDVWDCSTGKGLRANFSVVDYGDCSAIGKIDRVFSLGTAGAETLYVLTASRDLYSVKNRVFEKKATGIVALGEFEHVCADRKKRAVFHGWGGAKLFDGETFTTIFESPAIYGCSAGDRLFFVDDKNAVHYCAPLDETDFSLTADDSGVLTPDYRYGKIIGMQEFDGSVYLFSEQGISRLETRGAAREFTLQAVRYQGGRIFTNTIVRSENGVCFLAEDGIYLCSGLDTKRMFDTSGLAFRPDYSYFRAAYGAGRYFVQMDVDAVERTLVVDLRNQQASYLNSNGGLGTAYGRVFLCCGVTLGAFSGDRISVLNARPFERGYVFNVPNFELCPRGGEATIERIDLFGRGEMTVTVSNGKTEKVFERTLEKNEPILVRLKGESVSLRFSLEQAAELDRVDVCVQTLKG